MRLGGKKYFQTQDDLERSEGDAERPLQCTLHDQVDDDPNDLHSQEVERQAQGTALPATIVNEPRFGLKIALDDTVHSKCNQD